MSDMTGTSLGGGESADVVDGAKEAAWRETVRRALARGRPPGKKVRSASLRKSAGKGRKKASRKAGKRAK